MVCVNVKSCVFRAGTEIVSKAAKDRVIHYLQALRQHFSGMCTVFKKEG